VLLTKTSASTEDVHDDHDHDHDHEHDHDHDDHEDDDDGLEGEVMFVEAHPSFEFAGKEWGGPRRGGRLPEPTRYGDWERKGRCSDF
jgi:hypothetical protein